MTDPFNPDQPAVPEFEPGGDPAPSQPDLLPDPAPIEVPDPGPIR